MTKRKKKEEDILLARMIKVMIAYSLLVQLLLLVIRSSLIYQSVGLWIGTAIGIGMIIHIKRSVEDTLQMGEYHGPSYSKKKTALRLGLMIMALGLTFYFNLGSMLTVFIGIMGLKVSAYLQPVINRCTQSK